MSKRRYPGTNWSRWFWLQAHHYTRLVAYYARNGASIGLIEAAVKNENYYRSNIGRLG